MGSFYAAVLFFHVAVHSVGNTLMELYKSLTAAESREKKYIEK